MVSRAISQTPLRIPPVVIYIVCSIVGIALGIFLSRSYVDSLTHGNAVDWTKLTSPPSPSTGFLEADLNQLFVQTEQGVYFSADIKQCLSPGRESCWSLVDEVDPGRLYLSPCNNAPAFFETPSPPIKYSQSLLVQECGPDYFSEIHYVLGENGEIWFWRHGSYAPGVVNVMILAGCIGASLGLFAGLFLANRFVVFLKRRGQLSTSHLLGNSIKTDARLVITGGTAKSHVHPILEKLGTESRMQAAVRARELGLV